MRKNMRQAAVGMVGGLALVSGLLIGTAGEAAAAPAAKAWTNCGPQTCTTYFTKAQTKAFANYFEGVAGTTGKVAESVFCGALGGLFGKGTGIVASGVCGVVGLPDYGVSAWIDSASKAASANGCLQVEKPRKGIGAYKPGYTTHPSYCRG